MIVRPAFAGRSFTGVFAPPFPSPFVFEEKGKIQLNPFRP